jgi:glycosyltransferase involved in cell wall biosynthesis
VHLLPRLVRSINPLADFASVRECLALVRTLRPDLIHAHSSKAGIVGRLAGRITRTPTIFTAHGWGFSPGVPRKRQILALQVERLMAPLAQKIICVSEFDRQLALRHRVGNENVLRTVRGGIRDEILAPRSSPNPIPRFIMVARFSEQKDQATLLKALSEVENLQLDLVGSGPLLAPCHELAISLGLEPRVAFLGDRNDVPQLLRAADAFVLSTHYEGLPISILEAMRAALPVVASDVGGNSEEIEHLRTGLLVPRGDVSALAAALRELAASPALRGQMGEAGRQKFLREFTVERMISGVEAIYDELWAPESAA